MSREEQINTKMRDLLIEHIDQKPLPIVDYMQLPPHRRDAPALRHNTLLAAWRRGYINFDRYPSPQHSMISPSGRAALAKALADWADAMTRCGSQMLGRLLPNIPGEVAEAEELAKAIEL